MKKGAGVMGGVSVYEVAVSIENTGGCADWVGVCVLGRWQGCRVVTPHDAQVAA